MCGEKRVMGKGEDVEKAVQRRHRRPSFFHYFFPLFFSCFACLVLATRSGATCI